MKKCMACFARNVFYIINW